MNFKALTFSLLFALLGSMAAKAVPACPDPLTMTQPDGTQIQVRLYGDERGHYYTTLDGILLTETANGFCYASLNADEEIVAGPLYAPGAKFAVNHAQQQRMIKLMQQAIAAAPVRHPHLNKVPKATRNATPSQALPNGMTLPPMPLPGLFPGSDFPTIGSPKVLVLLVQFSDVKFSSPSAHETLRNQITKRKYKERGFTGSALDYYADASMEQFTPQFDVIGPITVSGTQAYYGGNVSGGDARPREMVVEACSAIRSTVNFSDYDNNGDGYVDNIYVIYAGRGEASGGGVNTIWPHSWVIPDDMTPDFDGIKLWSYACGNELRSDTELDAIGTFCHEFGHVIGLPDLYSTSYKCENHPGGWALMASGSYLNNSRTPPTLSSWERGALGWLKPEVLATTGDYSVPASLLSTNKAFLIPTHKENEYFILENRQPYNDDWDNYLNSWGMLVWHIDYNSHVWDYNIVNDAANHQYANIVEAHGNDFVNINSMDVCFPGLGHYSLTESTTPALQAWDRTPTDIRINDIEEVDDEDSPNYTNVNLKVESRSNYDGVKSTVAEGEPVFISNGKYLRVEGAPLGQVVYIYTPEGREVTKGLAGMDIRVDIPGIYIAVCGVASAKVVLR